MQEKKKDQQAVTIVCAGINSGAGREMNHVGKSPEHLIRSGLVSRLVALGIDVKLVTAVREKMRDIGEGPFFDTIINETRRRAATVVREAEAIARITEAESIAGRIPVTLGGDHAISFGTVPGITKARKGRPCMIIWDAHLDFNYEETTITGNMHGMPVAANTGFGSEILTNVYYKGRKIDPHDVVIIGVNDPDPGELERARNAGITVITMEDFTEKMGRDVEKVREVIRAVRSRADYTIVSGDTDGIDTTAAPGTPMRNVRGGLLRDEVLEIAACAGEKSEGLAPVAGVEIAELAPMLDRENMTAELDIALILSALTGTKVDSFAPLPVPEKPATEGLHTFTSFNGEPGCEDMTLDEIVLLLAKRGYVAGEYAPGVIDWDHAVFALTTDHKIVQIVSAGPGKYLLHILVEDTEHVGTGYGTPLAYLRRLNEDPRGDWGKECEEFCNRYARGMGNKEFDKERPPRTASVMLSDLPLSQTEADLACDWLHFGDRPASKETLRLLDSIINEDHDYDQYLGFEPFQRMKLLGLRILRDALKKHLSQSQMKKE